MPRIPGPVAAILAAVALCLGAWSVHAQGLAGMRPRPPEPAAPHFARVFSAHQFVRGNLHTHTSASDGDASPTDVAAWYREHGYGFLALTDHNLLTRAADLPWVVSRDFALLGGEEVTMSVGGRAVHVNALCIESPVTGGDFPQNSDAIAHAVGAIRAQGGVALLNHPNFDWALAAADVVGADGAALLEIASGHPYVHSEGDATHPSHEQLWDAALTAGRDVMGVAVDDTHQLLTDRDPEAFPGAAWVEVFAGEPSVEAICDALRHGELYASTGPRIRAIEVGGQRYTVEPADRDAVVFFVGSGGRPIGSAPPGSGRAVYDLVGDEGYVRARVETARGVAWTPAVRVSR